MNTVQKLEISAGIASSASVLLIFFLFIGFALSAAGDAGEIFVWSLSIAHVWLISLTVAAGAYCDVTKRSRASAVILAVGALSIISISGFSGLFILMWGGRKAALITITPAILAFLTGIFAIFDRE
ncbi:MAG TPA: hypothetical protein VF599_05845 [Pyrinomonadaceae bacterium]|jgi:hypothetical protein